MALKSLLEAKVSALIRRGDPADEAAEEMLRLIERTGGHSRSSSRTATSGLAIHYAFVGPQIAGAAALRRRRRRWPARPATRLRLARVLANLCGQALTEDLDRSVRVGIEAVEAAQDRRLGRWADLALANLTSARLFTGDWDELLASVWDADPERGRGDPGHPSCSYRVGHRAGAAASRDRARR